jgi:hypothetical protein
LFRFRFFHFASKRNKINVFSLCFASKRNKLNAFSLHFTSYRLEKLKDQPYYFSSFLYRLSQNFTLSLFRITVEAAESR